jgi:hypothetical protein
MEILYPVAFIIGIAAQAFDPNRGFLPKMDGNISGCFIIRFIQRHWIGALIRPPTFPGPAGPGNRIPETLALLIQGFNVDVMFTHIFIGYKVMYANQPPVSFIRGRIGLDNANPVLGLWGNWLAAASAILDKVGIIALMNKRHGLTPKKIVVSNQISIVRYILQLATLRAEPEPKAP